MRKAVVASYPRHNPDSARMIQYFFRRTLLCGTASVLFAACCSNSVIGAEPVAEVKRHAKVAAVQISGYDKRDLPRDDYQPVDQFLPYIERAGNDEADLVVFPEYVLGHIRVPGPETERIAAAARANSIYVIIGCWEDFDEGRFANTALLFGRDGTIEGKYRKTHAAVDRFDPDQAPWKSPLPGKTKTWMIENDPEWVMDEGQDLPVFDLDFGKIGIMTCYDGWFPEPPRVLSLKGAEIVVWINGRGGTVEEFIVRSVMFQSHVAMIATNQAYGGGTMIGDCSKRPATILARSPNRKESYLTATLDLHRIRQMRYSSRNFSRRRPDLYGTLSDTTLHDR